MLEGETVKKRLRGNFVVMVAVAGCFISSATLAYAATVSSSYGYFTTAGTAYRNQATAYDSGHGVARTYTATWPTKSLPAGWIGSKPRSFKSSGALCMTEDYGYTSIKASGIDVGAYGNCGAGNYYSYGASATWNGNGYNYTYTFKSPNIYFS